MFLLTRLQRWWSARHPAVETSAPYEVTCSCGRSLRGQRQPYRQIVICPACGQKRFILPSSPWPARPKSSGIRSGLTVPAPPHLRLWRMLLVIIAGGLATMGLLYFAIKLYLRPLAATAPRETPESSIQASIESGRRHLGEGNVRLAVKEFDAAIQQCERNRVALGREEHHRLNQLRRQTDLIAHLLDSPLEEILQQGMQHRNNEEWQAKFEDYRGRSVLFDDVLRRDATGRPMLGFYVVRVGDVEARVALEDLTLVRQLPLDPPRRCLFGARLASCRREEGGVWVIRFEPDSGVLLTDEDAAAACCPGPVDDELRAVLRRQDEWLRR